VRLSSDRRGAPFALALSARRHVYKQFDGGPGQIAIHGLANVGGKLGTAASNGCVRLAISSVTWLAMRIGAGVPVTIR
jgi:lipoprotein-anchoring transpeptidase ErfK/SrfK